MGSRGRVFFDLNELPAEEEDEANINLHSSQPQEALPSSNTSGSNVDLPAEGSQGILDNRAFIHASKGSGFQPFVRVKDVQDTKDCGGAQKCDGQDLVPCSSGTPDNSSGWAEAPMKATVAPASVEDDREEGELCDMEADRADHKGKLEDVGEGGSSQKQELSEQRQTSATDKDAGGSNMLDDGSVGSKDEMKGECKDLDNSVLPGQESSRSSDCSSKGDANNGGTEEPTVARPKDVKGVEAMHALRFANNPAKRPKLDEHKEAMLGKKRSRQTVFLNISEVKMAGPMKSSTPKRQTFPSVLATRTVKETGRANTTYERQGQAPAIKDQKQAEPSTYNTSFELIDNKVDSNGSVNAVLLDRSKKLTSSRDSSPEVHPQFISRQVSLKQPADQSLQKNLQNVSRKPSPMAPSSADQKAGNKKHPPKKPNLNNSFSFQDTSVERLIREVTNENFWLHPEESDLQCVPGQFDSVEDYVRVFEPLLLEECRAQLYSTWEESTEHIMVRVKHVEKRERGWYDAVLLPPHEMKWSFKEGDAAVLSTARPGTVRSKRNSIVGSSDEAMEPEFSGRVAGTVRRYSPVDTRDLPGAILHFYVGDAHDPGKADEEHILRKLLPRSAWYLTSLGSLATTQREYVALHAFRRLNLQMQTAILKPSPDQFPKYEEKPPAMPDCFTQNFVDHLFRTFNGPQLAAIQWAAMHTAAGTSGATKKQDPWPFTLVQGPPGTGKTHTVWGMLNVIHLVQYQHYYAALLKKLAPESYRQPSESSYESTGSGSIDEVLQNMDQNLFRTLPKLCPKPRMLVCAPSNAATDELLARVLNRGFIDGEMKIYRPDVARVGVDSQNRAAQAVSVEQRTNLLLEKGRDEVIGWLQSLKMHEAQCSQKISQLQRQLNAAAAVGRSQGSVGVDPDVLVARDHNRDMLLQNLAQVVEQRDKILVEMSRLLIVEGKFRSGGNFNIEEARANLEASFANEAEIVFTTVSSSGRKLFSRLTHGFDMIVIDEAAQASEVGVLPPLSLGAARCVLVGDPQQLPATVISKAAGTLLYSRSLFERFQQAGCPTMLLSIQYRMHPQIRDFPSRYFYQGRLLDSESVSSLPDEAYYKDPLLQPYMFFDMMHGRESHKGGSVSYQNVHEAQFCLKLYEHLQSFVKTNGGSKVSVGIITPYKLQLRCVEREFEQVLRSEEGKDLYINTVDAFQGQERDVIIMSCVRASSHGVGFVADIRRMNVALTRARRALWVVGNANALMQSEDWAALIADAKSRKRFMDLNSIPKEFLILKGSNHDSPTKPTLNTRGPRTMGQRPRNLDGLHKSSMQFDEDKSKNVSAVPRNGSYRSLKLQTENPLDDIGQSNERPREAWQQQGNAKRPANSSGVCRRES